MKDFIALSEPNQVLDFVNDRFWRSEPFKRASKTPGTWLNGYVARFAKLPRLFYTITRPMVETSHFTTYLGAIALRPWYESDVISDLYYLHEIIHACNMWYNPTITHPEWYAKIVENEFTASLGSEALVYFYMPEIRVDSFPFPIWVDKYLAQWESYINPQVGSAMEKTLHTYLKIDRLRIMRDPHPFDWLELQIANYLQQNTEWTRIWSPIARMVEQRMTNFLEEAQADPQSACDRHIDWLFDNAFYGVPFYEQATQFAEVYAANKEKYGNKFATRQS